MITMDPQQFQNLAPGLEWRPESGLESGGASRESNLDKLES